MSNLEGAVHRVEKFLAERSRMRGLDHNEIASVNVGSADREAWLLVADLEALLKAAHAAQVTANWLGFRRVFARRLENLGRPTEEIMRDVQLSLTAEAIGENETLVALKEAGL